MLGLVCGASGGVAFGDDVADRKVSRLGFTFDPRAHDAAVAADQKAAEASAVGLEPPGAGVLRLPKYLITDERVPLQDHEILTPKGKVEAAKQRYLDPLYQKTLGPLAAVAALLHNPLGGWAPNGPEAMALYEDDEQLRRNLEMRDLVELEAVARPSDQPAPAKPEKRRK